MLEVEVKLRPDEKKLLALRDRLRESADGEPVIHQQQDIYFSHPDRDFKARDEALRLRVDNRLFITWKGPKLDPPLKTREEIEFGLTTDPTTATRLLTALGFAQAATVAKTREQWSLPKPCRASICLDNVVGLGWFVEVEVLAEEPAVGREQIEKVLRYLDLDQEPFLQTSYLGLLTDSED